MFCIYFPQIQSNVSRLVPQADWWSKGSRVRKHVTERGLTLYLRYNSCFPIWLVPDLLHPLPPVALWNSFFFHGCWRQAVGSLFAFGEGGCFWDRVADGIPPYVFLAAVGCAFCRPFFTYYRVGLFFLYFHWFFVGSVCRPKKTGAHNTKGQKPTGQGQKPTVIIAGSYRLLGLLLGSMLPGRQQFKRTCLLQPRDVEFEFCLTISIHSDLHLTNCKSPKKTPQKTVTYRYVNVSHLYNNTVTYTEAEFKSPYQ